VTGLKWNLGDFASLSGDLAFQYRTNGDLAIAAASAAASFAVGDSIRGGVTGATVALLIKNNGTYALQTTGGATSLSLGKGFVEVGVQGMGFSYNNTGSDVDEQLDMSAYRVGVTAPLVVKNQVTTVVLTGLRASVGGFVTLSGDFALQKKTGPGANDDQLIVLTHNASARLTMGDQLHVGVKAATIAVLVNEDETLVIQASGSPDISLGGEFPYLSVAGVGIAYNKTGRNLDETLSIRVGAVDVSVPVAVEAGVATVLVSGLQAKVANFVSLSGDFAFQKRTATATELGAFVVVGQNAAATLAAGGKSVATRALRSYSVCPRAGQD
jgi:hypothetical protein